jgi:hypothetical protein
MRLCSPGPHLGVWEYTVGLRILRKPFCCEQRLKGGLINKMSATTLQYVLCSKINISFHHKVEGHDTLAGHYDEG